MALYCQGCAKFVGSALARCRSCGHEHSREHPASANSSISTAARLTTFMEPPFSYPALPPVGMEVRSEPLPDKVKRVAGRFGCRKCNYIWSTTAARRLVLKFGRTERAVDQNDGNNTDG